MAVKQNGTESRVNFRDTRLIPNYGTPRQKLFVGEITQHYSPAGRMHEEEQYRGIISVPIIDTIWVKPRTKADKESGVYELEDPKEVNGELLEIRFLPNTTSLDARLQELNGKLKLVENSIKYFIELTDDDDNSMEDIEGINKSHLPTLYKYLKDCNYNGSNPLRDDSKPILFYIKTISSMLKEQEDKITEEFEESRKALSIRDNNDLMYIYGDILGLTGTKARVDVLTHLRNNPEYVKKVYEDKKQTVRIKIVNMINASIAIHKDGEFYTTDGEFKMSDVKSVDAIIEKIMTSKEHYINFKTQTIK